MVLIFLVLYFFLDIHILLYENIQSFHIIHIEFTFKSKSYLSTFVTLRSQVFIPLAQPLKSCFQAPWKYSFWMWAQGKNTLRETDRTGIYKFCVPLLPPKSCHHSNLLSFRWNQEVPSPKMSKSRVLDLVSSHWQFVYHCVF